MSTPAARLEIDGRDISTSVFGDLKNAGEGGVLISLSVSDQAGTTSDTLELELDDREGFKAPPKGAEIKVWLGYEPTPLYMGRFKVDEWTKSGGSAGRTLRVSAKAAEMTGEIRARKSRSFDGKTVGEIANQIAGENGLTATVASSIASQVIEHIDQQNESDLGFLSRLAGRAGAVFKLADGKIVMAERGSSQLPGGGEKPTISLTPAMVSDWDATSADRGEYGAVSCVYMDHEAGQRVTVTEGSGTPKHRDGRLYGSRAEAEAAARAQKGDLARGKVSFATRGPGLPSVFAEAKIDAQGFDADVDGEFLIKTATHTLDSSGYNTSIDMERGGGAAEGD